MKRMLGTEWATLVDRLLSAEAWPSNKKHVISNSQKVRLQHEGHVYEMTFKKVL